MSQISICDKAKVMNLKVLEPHEKHSKNELRDLLREQRSAVKSSKEYR